MNKIFVDAHTFLGMHARDEQLRIACKNLFIRHFDSGLSMIFSHVGYCDHIVWGYDRTTQDAYYPFMDILHSKMNIKRLSLTANSIENTKIGPKDFFHDSLLGEVLFQDAVLYTTRSDFYIESATVKGLNESIEEELLFDADLESAYQTSRILII